MEGSNLIQVLTYAAIMASTIFIPIMAQGFGARPEVVGLIVSAYNGFFFLSSYLFGWLSDRHGGKYILRLGLLFAALCFALQIQANNVPSLLLARSLAGAGAGTFLAALGVYAYVEQKGKMGRFVGAGSLGWAIGAIVAGLISNNQLIFAMSSLFFLMAFFISLQMESGFEKPKEVSLFPFPLLRRNARIYAPYFFRALGAQAIWSIFPLYLVWAGADKLLVGVLYFTNLFSQFLIMTQIEKFKNLYLVNIGLLCTVLTFMGYALFPNLPALFLLQLLLAFSFSTLQVGSMQELLSKNVEQSTALSILNGISNLTAVVGPFIAGYVVLGFGYPGLMWTGAAITFVGLVSFTTVLE